jgi:tRNA-splicing ligase RtcB
MTVKNEQQSAHYDVLEVAGGSPVKMWTRGVPVEEEARRQLANTARMPFIHQHVAAMPDVHLGKGSTIGSVIPTLGAVIPAAVGVDIGCGMMAARTTLSAKDLPDNLGPLRSAIERAVPHGMSPKTRSFKGRDRGSWETPPQPVDQAWMALKDEFDAICRTTPRLKHTNNYKHLGTLGSGNHFIEICLDEQGFVWFMLHSGSRGVGNAIGSHFIELAKQDMRTHFANLPDQDLAYLQEGTRHYDDYIEAVGWAQKFARMNREVMMQNLIAAVRTVIAKPFQTHVEAVNCHHNYVQKERHFGKDVLVTRKGAVSAREGELGIIPGSMGAKSFIVRGKGNPDSFHSCSHGAGRTMSRTEARRRYSVEDQVRATEGVECRKDAAVIDEIPMAYKDIDAVMRAQDDLVEVVHTLKQVVCVKG